MSIRQSYMVTPNNDATDARVREIPDWHDAKVYAARLEGADDVYEVEIEHLGVRVYYVDVEEVELEHLGVEE